MDSEKNPGPQWKHDRMIAGIVSPRHGAKSTYDNYLCRCSACRNANSEYMRAYTKKQVA